MKLKTAKAKGAEKFLNETFGETISEKEIKAYLLGWDQALEVAAGVCDDIDTALNDGTITKKEDPTWPYSQPDVFHVNASNYVEQAAAEIRALKPKEEES